MSPKSKMDLALYIYEDMLLECMTDVAFQVHKNLYKSRATCNSCKSMYSTSLYRCMVARTGEFYGNIPGIDKLSCPNCNQPIASNRIAPHLDKCLGLGGRTRIRRPVEKSDSEDSELDIKSVWFNIGVKQENSQ
jgi:hypothetical protein